jgi:hypothetical protein
MTEALDAPTLELQPEPSGASLSCPLSAVTHSALEHWRHQATGDRAFGGGPDGSRRFVSDEAGRRTLAARARMRRSPQRAKT